MNATEKETQLTRRLDGVEAGLAAQRWTLELTLKEFNACTAAGFTPEVKARWIQAGHTPKQAAAIVSVGLKPESILKATAERVQREAAAGQRYGAVEARLIAAVEQRQSTQSCSFSAALQDIQRTDPQLYAEWKAERYPDRIQTGSLRSHRAAASEAPTQAAPATPSESPQAALQTAIRKTMGEKGIIYSEALQVVRQADPQLFSAAMAARSAGGR